MIPDKYAISVINTAFPRSHIAVISAESVVAVVPQVPKPISRKREAALGQGTDGKNC
jgi:hypothetical protein